MKFFAQDKTILAINRDVTKSMCVPTTTFFSLFLSLPFTSFLLLLSQRINSLKLIYLFIRFDGVEKDFFFKCSPWNWKWEISFRSPLTHVCGERDPRGCFFTKIFHTKCAHNEYFVFMREEQIYEWMRSFELVIWKRRLAIGW